MKNNLLVLLWVAGLLAFSGSVFAHHGTGASYDNSKPTQLKGIVTEFVWANPHAQLYFNVKDAKGNVVEWAGELNSPGVLRQQNWTKTTFKAGDEITITVFPSKAGTPVGVVDRGKPIIVNGKELVPARAGGNTID
jgi:Family of unknown function (DUF6152)